MAGLVSRFVRARSRWPGWVNRVIDALIRLVPEWLAVRVNPKKYGFRPSEVPAFPVVPVDPVRLYIAPVNFAAQGNAWARAAERIDGVGATAMQYTVPGGFGFTADLTVPVAVFANSRAWQREHFRWVTHEYTHVLIEAERSVFGPRFETSVVREAEALRARGISIAMLSHGSDLRLPSRHREIDQWSPFHEEDWPLIAELEHHARENRRILADVGAPVFVSTPDLIEDWPSATWLPVCVDPGRWGSQRAPLTRDRPVVLHAPTNPIIKGSHLVEETLQSMEGVAYRRITGVPSGEMPALVADADIVIEQFRIGTYSVAAVEAMAAGRLVIAHLHDQVRDHVRETTGWEIPIVEATPDTLKTVLADILEDREHYRRLAAEGPTFVRAIHDGERSAKVLASFLTR